MFSGVTDYVAGKVMGGVLNHEPYKWMEVDDFFPAQIYSQIISNRIPSNYMYSLQERGRVSGNYGRGRIVYDLKPSMPDLPDGLRNFWEELSIWMHYSLRNIFTSYYGIQRAGIKIDTLYTRDTTGFGLRPHTDTRKKLFTALVYIPADGSSAGAGTSIYVPKQKGFKCTAGLHHPYSDFEIYKTVDYKPNKMFSFLKSDCSFHGLEPISVAGERDLIIFDIQTNVC